MAIQDLRAPAILLLTAFLLLGGGPGWRAQAEPTMPTNTPAADNVDLRPRFEQWHLPLRRQGGRGTCSVFTLTGAIEYALARQDNSGTLLSVEFLNWASNQATSNAADGGFFSDLWQGYATYGICAETDCPYQAAFDPQWRPATNVLAAARSVLQARLQLDWIKRWDINTGLTPTQLQEIKHTLAQGWPVCAGMRWPKQEAWEQNVLKFVPATEVFDGHSVLLVGYQDDATQPGGGIFLMRNSGSGSATGALPYAYVSAYVNDAAWVHPAPER